MAYNNSDIKKTGIVNIPDVNFRNVILKQLGKDSSYTITPSDMESITTLTANNSNIKDITGIEYCTNLTSLNMSNNLISNISPLTNLNKLTRIVLNKNDIYDIYPLTYLSKK